MREKNVAKAKGSSFAVVVSLILLVAYTAAIFDANTPDVSQDEALTLWMVEDMRELAPASPSDALRIVIDNARQTFDRIRDSGEMPLYYAKVEVWQVFYGDALFTTRLLSAWFMLFGLSASFVLFRRLSPTINTVDLVVLSLFALAVGLFIGDRAEPATMMFAFSAVAVYAFVRWLIRPSFGHSLFYVIALAFSLMSHITAVFVIAGCGLVQLWRISRLVRANFSLATLYEAMHAVRLTPWLVLTAIGTAPVLVWSMIAREDIGTVSMTGIVALVALALIGIVSWLAMQIMTQRFKQGIAIGVVVLMWAVALLLTPSQPDYTTLIDELHAIRTPSEPALVSYAPQSIAAYHDNLRQFSGGVAVRLGWRDHDFEELTRIVDHATRGELPVWLMMPRSDVLTNQIIEILMLAGYTPDFCRSPGDNQSATQSAMWFYRFVPDSMSGDASPDVFNCP